MIKLTPDHVGTRVWLSNGEVGFVSSHDKETNQFWIEDYTSCLHFSSDGKILASSDLRVTLLFDAPNSLDVPVPKWCERIVGWHDGEGPTEIVPASRHRHWSKYPPDLRDLIKWSPAPGQLPPKNNEDIK